MPYYAVLVRTCTDNTSTHSTDPAICLDFNQATVKHACRYSTIFIMFHGSHGVTLSFLQQAIFADLRHQQDPRANDAISATFCDYNTM